MQEAVQRTGNYNVKYDFDYFLIKKIADNCGSKTVKNSIGYLSFIHYHTKNKFWCMIVDESAFIAGTFAKNHFRLIEIAVDKEKQNAGYGKFMLSELFQECISKNVYQVTFRTPMNESSHLWYEKLGAKKIGITKDDYEMRFNI